MYDSQSEIRAFYSKRNDEASVIIRVESKAERPIVACGIGGDVRSNDVHIVESGLSTFVMSS